MTRMLPKSPDRRWHPSQWNLMRVSSALGTTLALGACQDDTTSVDEATTVDTADATTEYSDSVDWTDENYTDYSDYADWTDEADAYTDYSDGWDYSEYTDGLDAEWSGYECYVDEDCGPGMACNYNYCQPLGECSTSSECGFDEFCDDDKSCVAIDLPAQCLAPALLEIPLPAEAGGVVVALRFVDLDAEPSEELVILRDDAIVVVDGDQVVTVPHSAFALDGIAATDVDGDGVLDLIATSSTKLNSRVFMADGMGGYIDSGTGPGMILDRASGVDWPTGGVGELLARSKSDQGILVSNVGALTPDVEILEVGPIESIVVGDFEGNGTDGYGMVGPNCAPWIYTQQGGGAGSDAVGPPGACSMTGGDFDGDPITDLAILRSDASFSVVTVHSPIGAGGHSVGLIGVYEAAQLAQVGSAIRVVLVQTGPTLEYLFADPNDWSWCRGELDELPAVDQFVTGDFDGDGRDEIAVLDSDGVLSLWSAQ